jgi:predicted kinase
MAEEGGEFAQQLVSEGVKVIKDAAAAHKNDKYLAAPHARNLGARVCLTCLV